MLRLCRPRACVSSWACRGVCDVVGGWGVPQSSSGGDVGCAKATLHLRRSLHTRPHLPCSQSCVALNPYTAVHHLPVHTPRPCVAPPHLPLP